MNKTALLLCSVSLLTACASAPTVQVTEVCPRLPEIEMLPQDALGQSFSDRMASFLQGKLPELTPSDYSLPSAKLPTARPGIPQ